MSTDPMALDRIAEQTSKEFIEEMKRIQKETYQSFIQEQLKAQQQLMEELTTQFTTYQQILLHTVRESFTHAVQTTLNGISEGIQKASPLIASAMEDVLAQQLAQSLPGYVPSSNVKKLEIPRDGGGRILWSKGKDTVFAVLQDLEKQGVDISIAKNVMDINPSAYVQIKKIMKGKWRDLIDEYRSSIS